MVRLTKVYLRGTCAVGYQFAVATSKGKPAHWARPCAAWISHTASTVRVLCAILKALTRVFTSRPRAGFLSPIRIVWDCPNFGRSKAGTADTVRVPQTYRRMKYLHRDKDSPRCWCIARCLFCWVYREAAHGDLAPRRCDRWWPEECYRFRHWWAAPALPMTVTEIFPWRPRCTLHCTKFSIGFDLRLVKRVSAFLCFSAADVGILRRLSAPPHSIFSCWQYPTLASARVHALRHLVVAAHLNLRWIGNRKMHRS